MLPYLTPFVFTLFGLKLFDKHVLGIDLEAMDAGKLKSYKEKELLTKKEKADQTLP